uniref:Odorant-binding protein 13 n=1 Tax=Propsilocerus akamusi TaxID=903466 RepID=A0A7D0TDX2_9DIPT|nr:odorant-binding protein 13 [Propsilocerus akamusi]
MKVIVAVVLTLLIVNAHSDHSAHSLTDEQLQIIEGHTTYCSEKSGIEIADAKKIRFSVIEDADEKNQCFTKCFFEQTGFMDEEGNLKKEVMLEKLAKHKDEAITEKITKIIDECTLLEGDTICNKSFKIHNCYWSKVHPHPQ